MQRHLLGLSALVLLGVGVARLWMGDNDMTTSACIRSGLVLGALWLALPQLKSNWLMMPRWLFWTTAIGLVLIIIRPATAWLVAPALLVIWAVRPRPKRSSRPASKREPPRRDNQPVKQSR